MLIGATYNACFPGGMVILCKYPDPRAYRAAREGLYEVDEKKGVLMSELELCMSAEVAVESAAMPLSAKG